MFNTPILLIIFNRPDTTKIVFEAIKRVKPKQLFIAADGPRLNKEGEGTKCQEARSIINEIDWDCDLKTLFRENNLGCGRNPSLAISWFFDNVNAGIIIEDDCLVSESFFTYCSDLLEIYKDDEKIMHITGVNLNDDRKFGDGSYYFSKYPHIWGWATWKRAWKHYNYEISDYHAYSKVINRKFKNPYERSHWKNILRTTIKNKINSWWDYQWMFTIWKENGLAINTNNNFVINIGFGEEATHTTSKSPYLSSQLREVKIISHPKEIKIYPEAERYFAKIVHGINKNGYHNYFFQRFKNLNHKLGQKIVRNEKIN